jgi:GAF domain-containing protein
MPMTEMPPGGPLAHGQRTGAGGAGWAVAVDALAGAAVAAAAASTEHQLREGVAGALAGKFADWVLVDLVDGRGGLRSVAGRRPDRLLAALLAAQPVTGCPLILAAIRRCTPVVRSEVADAAELGQLADGRSVLRLLGARSCAVSPLVAGRRAVGAISVIRGAGLHYVSFLDLGVLSQIADAAAAAVTRLRAGRAPEPGPGSPGTAG